MANKVKRLRLAAGMSLKDLSDAAGLKYSTVYRYEHGLRDPVARNLMKLAKALNVTTDELLEEDEPEEV